MLAQYKAEEYDGEVIPYSQYKEKQKQRKAFFRKQKACGILLVAIAAAAPFLIGDGTASLIFLPLGLYLTFTKQKIMQF